MVCAGCGRTLRRPALEVKVPGGEISLWCQRCVKTALAAVDQRRATIRRMDSACQRSDRFGW